MKPAARIVPCLVASVAIHGALFVGAPAQWSLAVASGRQARSISVELVPAGPKRGPAGTSAQQEPADRATPTPSMRQEPGQAADASAREPEASPKSTRDTPRSSVPRPVRPVRTVAPGRPAPATSGPARRLASRTAAPTDRAARATPTPRAGHASPQAHERPRTPDDRTARRSAETPANTAPRDDPDHATPAAAGARGRAATAAEARRVRKQVTARLARFFRYPPIAQRKGWEGRVVLTFRVLPDGRITHVRIVESSGRTVLDEAAVHALRQVKRVPGLPDRILLDAPLALRLPVTYRLQSA